MKKWIVPAERSKSGEVVSRYGEFMGNILLSRGIATEKAAEDFFGEGDFFGGILPEDIEKAAEIITEAMENGEKITVFGDYDCDGVTAAVMLYDYLSAMGAEVDYYIPERSEGYGMSVPALEKLINEGTKLVVTVDNGISAVEETEFLRKNGVKLVITDHHQPGDVLPVCDACVDPNRTDDLSLFKDLCGAGVVLKLLCVMENDADFILENYADLAAVGTIGDVMPLKGENRYIVNRGLALIRSGCGNAGLLRLAASAGITPEAATARDIAFRICPRINAAGRISSAQKAARLLLSESDDETARLCADINALNTERRELEAAIMSEISEQLKASPEKLRSRVIFLSGKDWHAGVIGIVSAKIVEKYGKPAVIVSVENGEGRGSCRGAGGFSIYRMLEACGSCLIKFGGHSAAGGFSLKAEDIPLLEEKIEDYAKKYYPTMPDAKIYADLRVSGEELTLENAKLLRHLEPFGEGNENPVFLLEGCEVKSKRPLKDGKYISFEIKSGNTLLRALSFDISFDSFAAEAGDMIDMIACAEINEYNGSESVQLRLLDYRPTGFREDRFFAAKHVYEAVSRGEGCDKRLAPRVIPQSRNDLMAIYDLIKKYGGKLSAEHIAVWRGDVNYCMLKIAADAFAESKMAELDGDMIRLLPVKEKTDLFAEGKLLYRLGNELRTES